MSSLLVHLEQRTEGKRDSSDAYSVRDAHGTQHRCGETMKPQLGIDPGVYRDEHTAARGGAVQATSGLVV